MSQSGTVFPSKIPWMPQNHTIGWISFAAILNLAFFWGDIIPRTMRRFTTDGGQLLSYLQGGDSALRPLRILTLIVISHDGARPREWDNSLIEQILAGKDGSENDVTANLYGYYHALDCGRIDEAEKRLDEAVALRQLWVADLQPNILLEAAYFRAFYRHDAGQARIALDLAKGGIVEEQTRLRAEAAVLLAEGRYEEAATKAQAGLQQAPHSVDRGGGITEAEWLSAILEECQKRTDQAKEPGPSAID